MASPLFVGIDAGGSGTRAALASADGEVLAVGLGGPSGVLGGSAGLRQLRRALADAVAPIEAYLAAQPRAGRLLVIHAGLRGLSIPSRRSAALEELSARFPSQPVTVSNDAVIAQSGGLGGMPGVAVLAGTGSIALARSADG